MRPAAVTPPIQGAIAELRAALPALVERIVGRIHAEVPEAAAVPEAELRGNVEQLLVRALDGLERLRPPTPEELASATDTGRRRARAGETLVAVLRSHRIGVREGWGAFQEIAGRRGIGVRTQLRFNEALWEWADAVIDAAVGGHREVEVAGAAAAAHPVQRLETIRLEDREPFVTADGSGIRELAGLPAGNAVNQSLAEATVPPGSATIEHFHRRSEEIYTFTAGSGRMRLGDEEAPVRAGDTVVIPPGVRHQLINDGSAPLVLLCCCAPPYTHEDTVLTGA